MCKQPLDMVELHQYSQITLILFIEAHPEETTIFLFTVALVLRMVMLELSLIRMGMNGHQTTVTMIYSDTVAQASMLAVSGLRQQDHHGIAPLLQHLVLTHATYKMKMEILVVLDSHYLLVSDQMTLPGANSGAEGAHFEWLDHSLTNLRCLVITNVKKKLAEKWSGNSLISLTMSSALVINLLFCMYCTFTHLMA